MHLRRDYMGKQPYKPTLCNNVDCFNKSCPNYSPKFTKGSFNFPDCFIRWEKQKNGNNTSK